MNANSGKDLVHLTDNSTRINGEPDWQSLQPGPGVLPPANTNHDRGRVLKRFRDGPSDREVFSRAVLGGAFFILRRGYSQKDHSCGSCHTRKNRILAIAMKANPACQDVKERLKVFPVMCGPTTNFAQHLVELKTGQMVERQASSEAPNREAIKVDFK